MIASIGISLNTHPPREHPGPPAGVFAFNHHPIKNHPMSRTLYSPRFSDDVVRALYREGQRRKMSMTRLADLLLRQALGQLDHPATELHCVAEESMPLPSSEVSAA